MSRCQLIVITWFQCVKKLLWVLFEGLTKDMAQKYGSTVKNLKFNFLGEFLYMYGSQEKILGQKVNVKFFTVDPYSVGTGVPRPFSKFANYWKNIFLKIKTSKIKSEKNIYQTIHNTRFIFIFFGIFTIFFVFFPIFWKKKYPNSEKITPKR